MKIEVRNDKVVIDGYVNAVGRDSRPISSPMGKFVEQVEPGAFRGSLEKRKDVDLLLNHRKDRRLGSTGSGGLQLFEDNIGLRAHAEITDSEVIEKARSGKLRGWSFGMYAGNDEFEERAGDIPRRHIRSLDLFEVSLIDDTMLPCYAGTSVECRADGDIISETRSFEDTPVYDVSYLEKMLSEIRAEIAIADVEYRLWRLKNECGDNVPEIRYNHNHDPTTGRFTSGSFGSSAKAFSNGGAKGLDKSEKSGIIKSSDDGSYISATGPNEFKKGFDAYNLADHWYGGENAHSHKDEYPGMTMKQYAERALTLVQMPTGKTILGYKTKDGCVVRYDSVNNDFVKGKPSEGIITMFKPNNGEDYYRSQEKIDLED